MDLKDFTPKSDVVVVTINHPVSGEPLINDNKSEMTITLYAPHTKEYKKVFHEQANKRLKEMQKTSRKEITLEEIEQSALETLVKITKEWNITFGGEVPKLTPSKAKEIYEEVFWIKNQLDEGVGNYLDFMKA